MSDRKIGINYKTRRHRIERIGFNQQHFSLTIVKNIPTYQPIKKRLPNVYYDIRPFFPGDFFFLAVIAFSDITHRSTTPRNISMFPGYDDGQVLCPRALQSTLADVFVHIIIISIVPEYVLLLRAHNENGRINVIGGCR